MVDHSQSHLTLRELFTEAERLTRGLIEHLDQGFSPRSHQLVRMVRSTETEARSDSVLDVSIRNQSAQILESDNFAEQISQKLEKYSTTIDEAVARIVTGA